MDVRLPDGTVIQNVPEGTTKSDLVAKLQRNGMAVPSEWLAQSPQQQQEQQGTANRSLASQIGLTLRAGVKGAMALPALGADAIGGVANAAQDLALGQGRGYRFKPTAGALDDLMSSAGLPSPDTPTQRIVSKATELGFGAGGGAKLAEAGANLVRGGSPMVAGALDRMAANSGSQVMSGAGAGAAGEHAKENGSGAMGQFVSSLAGGIGGAALAGGAGALADKVRQLGSPVTIQALDQRVNVILQGQGIDPATITPAMRAALRDQVGQALKIGGTLDEGAVSRLADYTRLGLTPTKRRISLDPFDVTQELNAEKQAAALGARDARLPQISQENNKTLLRAMDGFNPVADRDLTGSAAQAPIKAMDAAMKAQEKALYGTARDMAGGDIPLARGPFMDSIFGALNKENKIRFVPENIMAQINDISQGQIKAHGRTFDVPFDVKALDGLKTDIATAMRSTADGNVKSALRIIRNQLDATPMEPVKSTFGGNQLVTQQGAAQLVSADGQAANLKAALDAARSAAFQRRLWQESSPLIENTLGGSNASTFIEQGILSKSADPKHIATAAAIINRDPNARDAVRSGIMQYLKDQAIGTGNESQTANFGGRGWLSGLSKIGDTKLRLFFDQGEIEQLKAMGRVGAVETFQPRGSAVNNSNTAAGMGALIQGITKHALPLADKLPFGQAAIADPLKNLTIWQMGRPSQDIARGLISAGTTPQRSLLDPLLIPGATGMGLLSAP